MNSTEAAVLDIVKAYRAAVYAKHVDAFVALYHSDVRVFDMWGRWSYDGVEAWRTMVSEWFAGLGTERVAVDVDEVRTSLGSDLSLVDAFITYRGLSAEGDELRAMSNRVSWVLKYDGGWRIIHEHTSAPVDFATLKVNVKH